MDSERASCTGASSVTDARPVYAREDLTHPADGSLSLETPIGLWPDALDGGTRLAGGSQS